MANLNSSSQNQSTTQTTPEYNPIQQALIDTWLGQYTGSGDTGAYAALKAVTENGSDVIKYLRDNSKNITDPNLKSLITATTDNGFFQIPKIESKEYQAKVIDYIKENPSSISSLGIGQEGTKWAKDGNTTYSTPKIEDSPLYQKIKERNDYMTAPLIAAIEGTRSGGDGVNSNRRNGGIFGFAQGVKNLPSAIDSLSKGETSNSNDGLLSSFNNFIADSVNNTYGKTLEKQKDISTKAISDANSNFESELNSLLGKYNIGLDEARGMLKPVDVAYRNGVIPFTSKKNMMISSALSDLADKSYTAGKEGAKDILGNKISGESYRYGLERDLADTNLKTSASNADLFLKFLSQTAPNQSYLDFMNSLGGVAQGQQNFGLQTGTTSSSGSSSGTQQVPDASLLDQINTLTGSGVNAANIYETLTGW